jgi:hypothetical protein
MWNIFNQSIFFFLLTIFFTFLLELDSNQLDGKKFYAEMKDRVFEGPKGTNIEFIQDGIENNENDPQLEF